MDEAVQPEDPADKLATLLISPGYTDRAAIIAAMLASGHAAIMRVATGAIWEGESDIILDRVQAQSALRTSQIWTRAAEYLQGSDVAAIGPSERPPVETARTPPL